MLYDFFKYEIKMKEGKIWNFEWVYFKKNVNYLIINIYLYI